MIQLSNGAKVHAAFIQPASPGMKPNGVVFAETETDWCTWSIYWDGDSTMDDTDEGLTHEVWEAETGYYYQKSDPGAQRLAQLNFGFRLGGMLLPTMKERIFP